MSTAVGSQSSRTPFNHLRYSYPETWKRLVKIMDEKGAPTTLDRRPDSALKKTSGFLLQGSHPGPQLQSKVREFQRSSSDPAIQRWKEKERTEKHVLNIQKNTKRNPFGGWYEGSKFVEKIACSPDFYVEQ